MGRKCTSSNEGSGAGFAVLLVLFVVVKFFWWIVAAAVAVAAFYLIRAGIQEHQRRREIYARSCAEIAARADQQHRWVMQSDDRGVFGPEGATVMRAIRADGPSL